METITNAANSVAEAGKQAMGAGQQEKGEQQMKNDNTLTGKATGAKDAVAGGAKKEGHGANSDSYNPLK